MNLSFNINFAFVNYILFALSILILYFAIYYNNKTLKVEPKFKNIVFWLRLIRIVVLILILFLMFNPVFTFFKTVYEKSKFLIIFDTSLSMSFLNLPDKTTRFEKAINAVTDNNIINKLNNFYDIRYATLAESLKEVENFEQILKTNLKNVTDITSAIKVLTQKNDLKGALIISDGRNTGLPEIDMYLRNIKFPIYTVGVGTSNLKDLAISLVDYPKDAYLDSEYKIDVEIIANNLNNLNTNLIFKESNKVLSQTPVVFDNKTNFKVTLPFKPSKKGLMKYELFLSPVDGEVTDKNNKYEFFINVIEHKLRVFIIFNTPNIDFSYLIKFLATCKDVEFEFKFINTLNENLVLKQSDLNKKVDILVLGDIDFTKLDSLILNKIENLISTYNVSMLFIGGPNFNLIPNSKITARFPIDITNLKFDFDPTYKYKLMVNKSSSLFKLAKISTLDKISDYMWNEAPTLCGINYIKDENNKTYNFKIGPETLIYTTFICPKTKQSLEIPVVLVKSKLLEKSVAILGQSFWFLKNGQLFLKNSTIYDPFFLNLISWLHQKEEEKPFKVETNKNNYYESENIFVTITARYLDFTPISNPSFKITHKINGVVKQINPTINHIENEKYEFLLTADEIGEHEINVLAEDNYGTKISDSTKFIVLNTSYEMVNILPDYDLLKNISDKTGGKFYEVKNINLLLNDISKDINKKDIQITFIPLEKKIFLVIIIIALSIEWLIRRYKGFE